MINPFAPSILFVLCVLVCCGVSRGQSLVPDAGRAEARAGNTNPPTAGDPRATLKSALAAFESAAAQQKHGSPDAQRLYHRALAGFQSLVNRGIRNGRLYYNLANTHLRLGEVGRAIVNYRRALRFMPGDPRIEANLRFARSRVEVQIPKPAASAIVETLLFWHFGTSLSARTDTALVGYVTFWLLLIVALFPARRIPVLTWSLVALGVFTAAVGTSVIYERITAPHRIEGVLTADEVVLRKGSGEYYDPQFDRPLPAGVEFRVREAREDVNGVTWYLAELPDGSTGWLRADQAEII